jgi:hypothetical protein
MYKIKMKVNQLIIVLRTLQTGQFWYLFPHYYYQWKRSIDIERTAPIITAIYGTPDVPEVHMLTGAKQHIDLLYAAKSFVHHYKAPVSLIIHLDRTNINEDVIRRIERHLPQVKILTRQVRDELVDSELEKRGLKYCKEFRKSNVLAAKLIDACLLSRSDRIIILDTDCLAFKSLHRLRELVSCSTHINVVTKDPQAYPYSIPLEQIKSSFGVDVKLHINTGLCIIDPRSINLSIVDKWLSTPGYPMNHPWAEQTIIAALVSRGDAIVLPENEYNTGRVQDEKTCRFIHYCGHYLSSTRFAMRSIGQSIVLKQLGTSAYLTNYTSI